jgi:hypothetical protein
MSSQPQNVTASAAPADRRSREAGGVRRRSRWFAIPFFAFAFTVAVMFLYKPASQALRGDPALYEYIAQSILRGQVPYRDVIDPKGPGAMYASALAMLMGRALGLGDILSVRLFYIVMAGLLSAAMYLVAEAYLENKWAAVLAFLVPMIPSHYALMMVSGTQPKLLMMLFGMLSLVMVARDRPLLAGFFSMLSCICWQPGLMFTGVAFLMFSRYLTFWRDRKAIKVVIGAVVPLGLVFLYFGIRGALSDLWAWAFTYDYSVFMPEGKRPVRAALSHLAEIVIQVFGSNFVFLYLAAMGLLIFIALRVRVRLGGNRALQDPSLFKDAIVIPPVVYLIFCVINFQGGPDLIPFFAFIGIFAACFFLVAGRSLSGVRLRGSRGRPLVPSQVLPAAAALLVLATVVVVAASYRQEGRTLQEQYQDVEVIASLLKPEDKLYIHGPAEILVLLHRPNMNPYIALNSGADNFIASRTPGGFQAVIDQMEAEAPKIVAMGRLRNVRHRAELEEWVDEHYEKLALPHLESVYIRK